MVLALSLSLPGLQSELQAASPSDAIQETNSSGYEDPGEILVRALRSLESEDGEGYTVWLDSIGRAGDERARELGMATLDWLQFRYDEAERRLGPLLASDAPNDDLKAFALLSWGEASQVRGGYARALDGFQEALSVAEEAGSRRALAWSHVRLAGVRGRLEGLAGIRDHLLAADTLVGEEDLYLRALFHCSRAGADPLERMTAREDLEAGAALALEAGVRRLFAGCLGVRASLALRTGETGEALDLFHQTQEIQASVRDRAGRAGTLQRAGYVFVTLGSYGMAQSYLEEAIREGEASQSFSAVAWAYMNLSTIAWGLGDLATARTYADRAEAMMREQGDVAGLDVVTGQKGDLAFAAGDYPGARQWLEAALVRYRERGGANAGFGAQNALMRLSLAEGDLEGAEEGLAEAREIGIRAGMGGWVRSMLYDEGEIGLQKGQLDRAADAFEGYLDGGQWPPRAYKGLVRWAEVMALKGDLDQAEYLLTQGIEGIERWRTTLDVSGLRRYAFQIAENSADPDLGVATVIAALAADGRVKRSFDLTERQRARGLFESMVRADAARGLSLAGPLLTDEVVPEAPDPLRADELLARIQDPESALVEFVTGVGGEPTTAFILTNGEISAEILPPVDSLRTQVERLNALVQAGADPTALAGRLGSALFDPILNHLPPSVVKLAVIPDGVLHRLPFDLLGLGDGSLLIGRFSLSLAPSATVLAQLWDREPRPPGSTLLAMGDPSTPFENGEGDPADRDRELRLAQGDLPPLPGSSREVRLVARFSDSPEIRTGDQASEAFLKRAELEDFRILHFATHALVDESTVARTALVLAPEGEEDGLVSPGDLGRLKLNADLVVLSACRTAGGSVIRGEGIQGLTAPLLGAGAQAVLATRWEIEDRSGRRFIEDLYRGLAEGSTVGEALRDAKLGAIGRGEPAAQWAAFTLVGDPDVRVELREPTRWGPRLFAGMVGILFLGTLVLRRRRA